MFSNPSNLMQSLRLRLNPDDVSIWYRFRRNVSISVLGSVLSLTVKLAQTVLLTKVLKIEDYGRVLIVINLFVFLDSFFGMRVNDVVFRFFLPLREAHDARALKGLMLFCFAVCLVSGVLICFGVVAVSPLLTDRLYPGLEMGPLFRIYACTILVSAFSGLYEPLLRIHHRFLFVVRPQVVGTVVTFVILCIYFLNDIRSGFATNSDYNLKIVVAAFTTGALIQSLPPFIQALWLMKPILRGARIRESLEAIRSYRRELIGCFLNSNLSNYLKIAMSPGDVFILGICSTPTQLALYGVAKQLTAPLGLLLVNVQTAINPEITTLVARKKFDQLRRLVVRYVVSSFLLSSLLLLSALLLGRLLIVNGLQPEYRAALPVFCALTVTACLLLVFLVFRPLAVSLDLLKWHNLALLSSAGVVIAFVFVGGLNAMTMAYAQLAEVLIFRSGFNLLVWTRLKRLDGSPMVESEAATQNK
jgi:O-antigen/teichoic acid export membrane protein